MFDGNKIRVLRNKRKLSLKDLAVKAEVSVSMISKIERNEVDPSVTVLYKICNGLDVSVAELIGDAEHQSSIMRKSEREKVYFPRSNSVYELITPQNNGNLEMMMISLEPNQTDKQLVHHRGEECGVVLEGALTVILDETEYILNEGDSICFHSSKPHRFFNHTNKPSISIWAMTE